MSSLADNLSRKFDALSESVGGTRKLALVTAAGVGAVAAAYYVVPVAWQAVFGAENDPYGPGEIIQPNVLSDLKDESLFLIIYLKCEADLKACAAAAARLQSQVVLVNESKPGVIAYNRDYEVIAGVGFGQNLYSQVVGRTTRPFSYVPRSGRGGALNATGGDIFIHAKSNSHSKLFELADRIVKSLPRGSVDCFEDIYGFVYKDGRDFTGCPYGRANPDNEADRFAFSVNEFTQGSFCLTQKWVHDLNKIHCVSKRRLENIFGIYKDGSEMRCRGSTSHVSRMRNAVDQNNTPVVIYRQSMPYGSLSSREKGLFFVGFANDPERFEVLLDRMVGACPDGLCDEVFNVSRCLSGQYWYFPSIPELRYIARKDCCSIMACLTSPFSCDRSNKRNVTKRSFPTTNVVTVQDGGAAAVYSVPDKTRSVSILPSARSKVVTIANNSDNSDDGEYSPPPPYSSAASDNSNSSYGRSIFRRLTMRSATQPRNNKITTTIARGSEMTTVAVDVIPSSNPNNRSKAGPAVEVYGGSADDSTGPRVVVQPGGGGGGGGDNSFIVRQQTATSAPSSTRVQPELYPSKLYFSNNGQVSAAYRRA